MADWLAILLAAARAALAGALLFVCAQDWPAARARAQFDALPDFDYVTEARRLWDEQRLAEALLVIEAGRDRVDRMERRVLDNIEHEIELQRDDWLRRVAAVGEGALRGEGDSVEALVGAITADLFLFGDVRDLVIQGAHAFRGEETDEIIVALSAAGIALTAAPGLDAGAALVKFARKTGALSEGLARELLQRLRSAAGDATLAPVTALLDDAGRLGRNARPAAALVILREIDDVQALRLSARVSEKPAGAFALWVGGRRATDWLRRGGPRAEALLLHGARKGKAGVDFIATHGPLLLRAHPFTGLLKGIYKGNLQDLLWRAFPRFGELLLGLVAGWFAFETSLVVARLARRGTRVPQPEPA